MAGSSLIDIGLPIALFIIMVGMGLTLGLRDFRDVFVYPKASAFGTLAQIVGMPILAFGLAWSLRLDPALAVGLVVIAACPGGTTSNIFTYFARGNVALSIVLTVVASLITVATLPVIINAALDWFPLQTGVASAAEQLSLPVGRTVGTLLAIVILPVAIGMAFRRWRPILAAKLERAVGVFGLIVLVVIIALILGRLGGDALPMFRDAGLAVGLLNIFGIGLGLWLGRRLGIPLRDAVACAMELGIKNGTLGLLITLTLLDSPEMAVPSAVYGLLMFVFGGTLITWARRRLPPQPRFG
ncbi:MAG: bile acid:sodium symporter family protein [Algiphilus sp.]